MAHTRERIERIAQAIQNADKCELFYADEGCDGLQGCMQCLRLAARAVESALEGEEP